MTLQPYSMRISSYSVIFDLLPVAGLEPACSHYMFVSNVNLLQILLTAIKKGPQSEDHEPDKSSAGLRQLMKKLQHLYHLEVGIQRCHYPIRRCCHLQRFYPL